MRVHVATTDLSKITLTPSASYNYYEMNINKVACRSSYQVAHPSVKSGSMKPELGIRCFAHSLFALCSKSLKLKSDHEPFAKVAHDKKATVSESLRSLMTKERQGRLALFSERITLSLT